MKRTIFVLLLLICALTLCACVFGGEEEPEVTDPIYSYDIDVCVYDPDPAYEPRYYHDLSFRPYDEGHFIGGVNSDMYTLEAYYTEPYGQGIKICGADLVYTQEFKDYVVSTGGKLTYTAYPVAERVKCTVTVVTGTDRQIGPFTCYSGEQIRLPMDLERYGYTFDYWRLEGGGTAVDGVVDCYGSTCTVYAMYRPIETPILFYYFGSLNYSQVPRALYEQDYKFYYEEHDGYNFKGFFSEENGGGVQYTDEEGNSLAPWDYVAKNNDDVVYMYAHMVEAPEYFVRIQNTDLIPYYTVTLKDCDIDRKTGERKDRVLKLYDGDTLEYCEPYLENGQYFDGWCTDKYLYDRYDFSEAIKGDLTLYPKIRKAEGGLGAIPISEISEVFSHLVKVRRERGTYYLSNYVFNHDAEICLTIRLKDPRGYERYGTVCAENVTTGEVILAQTRDRCDRSFEFNLSVKKGEVIKIAANFYSESSGVDDYLNLYTHVEVLSSAMPKSTAVLDLIDEFPKEVTKGNTYWLKVYQQEGYTFLGYYTEPGGKGTKLTDEKGKSLGKYNYDSDVKAYAYYKKTEQ